MRLLPTSDHVLVELDPFPGRGAWTHQRPEGLDDFEGTGIIRPDIAEERSLWGTVRGVGPGRRSKRGNIIPTTLRPGDRVMVPWHRGDELIIAGVLYIMIREGDLMAVAA